MLYQHSARRARGWASNPGNPFHCGQHLVVGQLQQALSVPGPKDIWGSGPQNP